MPPEMIASLEDSAVDILGKSNVGLETGYTYNRSRDSVICRNV